MDGQRFDDMARALSVGASRRKVLRGLAGGLAVSLIGALGRRRAAAKEGSGGNGCVSGSTCPEYCGELPLCSGGTLTCTCGPCKDCPNGAGLCVAAYYLEGAACTMANGTEGTCASGTCVETDPCATVTCGPCEVCQKGACGSTCASDQVCENGRCVAACLPLTTCPTDVCGTVADGCGGTLTCGCPEGRPCVSGRCPGQGPTCSDGQVPNRDSGQCECPPGRETCGAECVNTRSDANHCGGCGNVCQPGQRCSGGTCR